MRQMIRLALVIATIIPAYAQSSAVYEEFKRLTSSLSAAVSLDQRDTALVALRAAMKMFPAQKRKEFVDWLLSELNSKSEDAQDTAALALGRLGLTWEASTHEQAISSLYRRLQTTNDVTLRRNLDDALANAKGLYFDAIVDYKLTRAGNIPDENLVSGKFARMARDFRESRYAGNAAFYLGQYWARLAFVRDQFSTYIPKSNDAFDNFIAQSERKQFRNNEFEEDARFYRALNDILVKDEKAAIQKLEQLRTQLQKQRRAIYVYQLFYSTEPSTVIDRFFPGADLVAETISFIQARPGALPGAQSELAAILRGKK